MVQSTQSLVSNEVFTFTRTIAIWILQVVDRLLQKSVASISLQCAQCESTAKPNRPEYIRDNFHDLQTKSNIFLFLAKTASSLD